MKKILMISAVVPALFLSGCGEGWEMKLYDGVPYGNTRTAGHGVQYVRANMMPAKGPVIEAAEPESKVLIAPEPTPEPIVEDKDDSTGAVLNSGEKFFRELQKK